MSATTAQLLAQIERFGPRRYLAVRAILAGIAAQLAAADAVVESFATSSTVAGATGAWLTLLARGYGIDRGPEETDAALRERLVSPASLVTRAGILALVDALLDAVSADPAKMLEPWDEGFADVDAYCDVTRHCGEHNSFVLVVPLVGDQVGGASYLDVDDYLDSDVFGGLSGEEHAVYAAIRAAVMRARAAGIRATLAIDT